MDGDAKTIGYTGQQLRLRNGNDVAVGISDDGTSVALQFTNNKGEEPKVSDLRITTEAAIALRDLLNGLLFSTVQVAFNEESPNA